MPEPLFGCNLACRGCGKIQYPPDVMKRMLSPEECWKAADECGAPVVAVAGGEPLIHPEIGRIVEGIIARGRYVHLCTNALLLEKNLDKFKPGSHLVWSVHLDGGEEVHDRVVGRKGAYQTVTWAIRGQGPRAPGHDQHQFRGRLARGVPRLLRRVHGAGRRRHDHLPGYVYDNAPSAGSSSTGPARTRGSGTR